MQFSKQPSLDSMAALEKAVIQQLRHLPDLAYAPGDLLEALLKEGSASDAEIREAIWRLVDKKNVQFTADRKFRLVRPVVA